MQILIRVMCELAGSSYVLLCNTPIAKYFCQMQKLDTSQKECNQLMDRERLLIEEVSKLKTELSQSAHVSILCVCTALLF